MSKKNFLLLGEDKDGFEIANVTMGVPSGVSKEMLWDLWDIGVKFGQRDENGLGFKATPLQLEIYDFRDNGLGGGAGFTVAKIRPTLLMDEGVYMLELKNGMHVLWDMGLTADDINQIIKKIDEFSVSEGFMKDGIRLVLYDGDETFPPRKMKVEHVFTTKGAVMMAMPDNLEKTLKGFDYPELLAVIEMGALRLICLASEKEVIIKQTESRTKRLREMGYDLNKIGDMSVDEILKLRKILMSAEE